MQEAACKNVGQAFGALQAWFAILSWQEPGWNHDNLQIHMICSVILHNMIIENKREMNCDYIYNRKSTSATIDSLGTCQLAGFSQFVSKFQRINNSNMHTQLQNELVSHLWALKGCSETKREVS